MIYASTIFILLGSIAICLWLFMGKNSKKATSKKLDKIGKMGLSLACLGVALIYYAF